jgi:hypothetical protein
MSTYQTILMPFPKKRTPETYGHRDKRAESRRRDQEEINSIMTFLERTDISIN